MQGHVLIHVHLYLLNTMAIIPREIALLLVLREHLLMMIYIGAGWIVQLFQFSIPKNYIEIILIEDVYRIARQQNLMETLLQGRVIVNVQVQGTERIRLKKFV